MNSNPNHVTLTPENAAIVVRHVEAETAHKMEETLATLTEDCVFEDCALGKVWHGKEGARDHYRMWWDAFGVMPQATARYTVTPEQMVVELRFTGTHVGPFLGIAPTGRKVDIPMVLFVELRDGLLHGEKFYWNIADLLTQLGIDLPVELAA